MVGENQDFSEISGIPLSKAQIQRILSSPETAALIQLLKRDGGNRIQTAAASFRKGDTEAAKAALKPLLQGTDGEDLMNRLGGSL